MEQFIYEIVRVRHVENEWAVLNKWGEDGWELCTISPVANDGYESSYKLIMYMKKKVIV